jgi:hypothetical protein
MPTNRIRRLEVWLAVGREIKEGCRAVFFFAISVASFVTCPLVATLPPTWPSNRSPRPTLRGGVATWTSKAMPEPTRPNSHVRVPMNRPRLLEKRQSSSVTGINNSGIPSRHLALRCRSSSRHCSPLRSVLLCRLLWTTSQKQLLSSWRFLDLSGCELSERLVSPTNPAYP